MSNWVRYPRTFHLPWSRSFDNHDRVLSSTECFNGKQVVVTTKLDGENTTMYNDHIHARSLDSRHHVSRSWVKALHASIQGDIPENWRICGENLFAEHSIHYNNLKSYFYVFSIWDENNVCLNWDATIEWCGMLGLEVVPVLYDGIWDEDKVRALYKPVYNGCDLEGYVIRNKAAFAFEDFVQNVAKFVRPNHVCKKHFWMEKIIPNELIKE